MIAFATLFLGLVLGVQTVEVMTSDDVVRVELLLDGRPLALIEAPPWAVEVDLGTELAPRALEAAGYDAAGREIARATQWLNVPRQPAELEILLEPGESGRGAVARLSWDSIAGTAAPSVRATFDGIDLPVADPRRIELPAHDPRQLHFLRVEATFDEHVGTVAERVLGGTYADQLSAQLTAVPVHLTARGDLPSAAALDGWVTVDGEPVPVLAVDAGPADLIVVRDPSAQPLLDSLAAPGSALRYVARLKGDQRIRFLSPWARPVPRNGYSMSLFEPSETLTARDGGLHWLLTRVRPRHARADGQRLADAVASAGMMAAGGGHPRAVLLVLGPDPVDRSALTPEAVRGYLQALRVPLVVWSVAGGEGTVWGRPEAVDSIASLERAAASVRRLLERQRILWVEGVHLPQRIGLAERALARVALAR